MKNVCFFCSAILLFVTGCNPDKNNVNKQYKNIVEHDSIWINTPTIDDTLFIADNIEHGVSIARNLGMAYFENDFFEHALQYYSKVDLLHANINNPKIMGIFYYLTGMVYKANNETKQAIESFEKAVALNSDDPYALTQLAYLLSITFQFEKANSYFEEALRESLRQNELYLLGQIYFLKANLAAMTYDVEKIAMYAQKALQISRETNNLLLIVGAHICLCKAEQLRGDFAKSEAHIKEAIQIATENGLPKLAKLCYMMLSEVTISQKDYSDKMQYWTDLMIVENAIATEATLRVAEEMEVKYEAKKKELEIERQNSVIAHQNMQHWFWVAGIAASAIIIALLLYMLYMRNRRNRALKENSETLAEMNATKDKFFSIISHDLKNPTIAQRDAIRMLVKNVNKWDKGTLQNFCCNLLQSAESEVALLHNLLNWAQLQNNRMAFQPGPFDLAFAIHADLEIIGKIANDKDIEFVRQIPEQVFVTADENMITIVIRNLLANAVKFTDTGGIVRLDISPYEERELNESQIRQKKRGQMISGKYIISITDTGVGISEEEMQTLMRYNNHHTKLGTAGETGTGFGLIVCKEMLEKHGTLLQIESEKGKGSRFWFEIFCT